MVSDARAAGGKADFRQNVLYKRGLRVSTSYLLQSFAFNNVLEVEELPRKWSGMHNYIRVTIWDRLDLLNPNPSFSRAYSEFREQHSEQ